MTKTDLPHRYEVFVNGVYEDEFSNRKVAKTFARGLVNGTGTHSGERFHPSSVRLYRTSYEEISYD